MKVECPRCHTHVEKPVSGDPVCPTCGFGSDRPGAVPAAPVAPAARAATPTSTWAPPQTGNAWETEPKAQLNQTMAIVALVLGIVGCCFLGPFTGIPAAIVGGIAMKKAKAQPDEYGGYGMALAGLILGIITTLAGILFIVFVALGFMSVPDECWVDPESPECEEATGGAEPAQGAFGLGSRGLTSATPLAALMPFIATPRRHAG